MNLKNNSNLRQTVGEIAWLSSLQYFIAQAAVAAAWVMPYSWRNNTISDLGNTACNLYGGRLVCSPLHWLMNISFIVLGIEMVLGAMLLQRQKMIAKIARLGFNFLLLGGIGAILVGVFPENTISSLHIAGAGLSFLIGNLGVLLIGLSHKLSPVLKAYTLLTGVLTLSALVLFLTHHYLGLGIGGMERLVGYPQTLWLIIYGWSSRAKRTRYSRPGL